MKKFPVELLTSSTANLVAGSPLIWDGREVEFSTDDSLNLRRIAQVIVSYGQRLQSAEATNAELGSAVTDAIPDIRHIRSTIPQFGTRLGSIEELLAGPSGIQLRTANVEERVNSIEQDINNILATGGGGSGGGGLSSVYSSILSALNTGAYFTGESGVIVEKINNGSAIGQYRIKLANSLVGTTISSQTDLLDISAPEPGQYKVKFNVEQLRNYITATKGLTVDPAIADVLTIKPTSSLIKGDNSTIKIMYNEQTGTFTASLIGSTSTGGGGAVTVDNRTLTTLQGVTQVVPAVIRATAGELKYESGNFNSLTSVATIDRFTKYSAAELYAQLATVGLASVSDVVSNGDLSPALKAFAFNTANAAQLGGSFYMLRDANSIQASIEHTTNGVIIDDTADLKNFFLDLRIKLRAENLAYPPKKFASNYPITSQSLMFPFFISVLTHVGTGKVCMRIGDVLQYGKVSGDGYGAEYDLTEQKFVSNAALSSKFLTSGLYRMTTFFGVKVANSADAVFNSAFIGNFAFEPKVHALCRFN